MEKIEFIKSVLSANIGRKMAVAKSRPGDEVETRLYAQIIFVTSGGFCWLPEGQIGSESLQWQAFNFHKTDGPDWEIVGNHTITTASNGKTTRFMLL